VVEIVITLPPGNGNKYKAYPVTDFGYGLMTREPPTQVPHGAALVSRNCDYDSRNVSNRRGYASVLENGPGATKIADFESGEAWSGGSADTSNFIAVEAAATGTRGRTLSVAATGGGAQASMTLAVSQNLGVGLMDMFHLWTKVTSLPATVTDYYLSVTFQTSGGNTYTALFLHSAQYTSGNEITTPAEQGVARYSRRRRQEFDPLKIGSPDWTNITLISINIFAKGSGTFTVTLDNLHRTPGYIQDLFQFRRQSGTYKGAADEYAIAAGVLYKNNGLR
jgi:hypothetical protein